MPADIILKTVFYIVLMSRVPAYLQSEGDSPYNCKILMKGN